MVRIYLYFILTSCDWGDLAEPSAPCYQENALAYTSTGLPSIQDHGSTPRYYTKSADRFENGNGKRKFSFDKFITVKYSIHKWTVCTLHINGVYGHDI